VLGCEKLLQIIFIILKIIGIILATIIGGLFVVLFIPIRYRFYGEKDEIIKLYFKGGWLLRLLYFTAVYENKQLIFKLRLFGIPIINNQRVKREKTKVKRDIRKTKVEKPTIVPLDYGEKTSETLFYKQPEQISKLSIFDKIVKKVKDILGKILDIIQKIKNMIYEKKSNFINMKKKVVFIKGFWDNQVNKSAIKLIFLSVKKFGKHILPKRIDGHIVFGTGDPCSTGQALGVISLIYGYYGNCIKITPDFENILFKGTVKGKGRIRIFTLLIISIKLWLDDNFKQLIINFKKLKEEL
jgi:hypothetical protein